MKGEIGASRETLRWFSWATKAARWRGLINNWNFAFTADTVVVDANTGRRYGWLFPRDRPRIRFSFPFLSSALLQSTTGLAAVRRYDTGHVGGIWICDFQIQVRIACNGAGEIYRPVLPYNESMSDYPTTEITPEETDFPTREISRRCRHDDWCILGYFVTHRFYPIRLCNRAVCLAAEVPLRAARSASPDCVKSYHHKLINRQ